MVRGRYWIVGMVRFLTFLTLLLLWNKNLLQCPTQWYQQDNRGNYPAPFHLLGLRNPLCFRLAHTRLASSNRNGFYGKTVPMAFCVTLMTGKRLSRTCSNLAIPPPGMMRQEAMTRSNYLRTFLSRCLPNWRFCWSWDSCRYVWTNWCTFCCPRVESTGCA